MADAALHFTPYGTPIAGLDFGEELLRREIAPGLVMSGGVSTQLAHMIAEDSGDAIHWPFAVVGFVDQDRRCLALAVHYGGIFDEATISLGAGDLPPTRRMLRLLAERLFVDCQLAAVSVRVRPDDEARQDVLTRLGFAECGRNDASADAARLIFRLDAATGLRRAFPCGLAHPAKVS